MVLSVAGLPFGVARLLTFSGVLFHLAGWIVHGV